MIHSSTRYYNKTEFQVLHTQNVLLRPPNLTLDEYSCLTRVINTIIDIDFLTHKIYYLYEIIVAYSLSSCEWCGKISNTSQLCRNCKILEVKCSEINSWSKLSTNLNLIHGELYTDEEIEHKLMHHPISVINANCYKCNRLDLCTTIIYEKIDGMIKLMLICNRCTDSVIIKYIIGFIVYRE